jgi:putative redox protein
VSLDKADHLLSRPEDAIYAAQIIAAWASRYIGREAEEGAEHSGGVLVAETNEGRFQNFVLSGRHRMFADEPEAVGGLDSGPSPYDYMSIALAACTSMTLRMYADRKKLDLGKIQVSVDHAKVHLDDCTDCATENAGTGGKIDRFERKISIDGTLDSALRAKMLEIADKCPVHRTLEHGGAVVTRLKA